MRPIILKIAKCFGATLIAIGPIAAYCVYLRHTAPFGGEDHHFDRVAVLITYSIGSLWFSILPVFLAQCVGIFLFLFTVRKSADLAVLVTLTWVLSVILTLSAIIMTVLTE